MRSRVSVAALCAGLATLGGAACDETTDGARVSVSVSPLRLPGIVDACYTLTVTNAPGGGGDTVWSEPGICSTRFGDGAGAITYIGTCDAGVETNNTAILELTSVTDEDGPADFVNPCGAPDNAPCKLEFPCEENADVPVQFDLTLMRPARQGFFDIAVDFEDVFCSAKFDCTDADTGLPRQLLFRPDGSRGDTLVAALACTAGPDAATVLHIDDGIRVTCGDETITLDPRVGPGNAYDATHPDPDLADAVWQYAVYTGNEQLTCDGAPCAKKFWNTAIGIDASFAGCSVELYATVSSATQMTDGLTPAGSSYPRIHFAVDVTGEDGGITCTQHALDGSTEVTTSYTPFGEQQTFCYAFDGTAVSVAPACAEPDLAPFVATRDDFDLKVPSYVDRRNELAPLRLAIVTSRLQIAALEPIIEEIDQQAQEALVAYQQAMAEFNAEIAGYTDLIAELEAERDALLAPYGGDPSGAPTEIQDQASALQDQIDTATQARTEAQVHKSQTTEAYNAAKRNRDRQKQTLTRDLQNQLEIEANALQALAALKAWATAERESFLGVGQTALVALDTIIDETGSGAAGDLRDDIAALLDEGLQVLDDIIGVGEPTNIFALCGNSTYECTCYDSSGELPLSTLACLDACDAGDVYWVD